MSYSVPPWAKEILTQMASILLSKYSSDQIVVGGGTALAARQHRRRSMDIDMFMVIENFRFVRDSLESALATTSGIKAWLSDHSQCRGSFVEGEFRIFTTPNSLSTTTHSKPDKEIH